MVNSKCMTQDWITTTGIIFRAADMKENDRLITLFSRDLGVIKTYLCGVRSKNHQMGAASAPLVEAEWVLKPGREELYLCKEASMTCQNLHLRGAYDTLQTACALAKITEQSVQEGDPCPEVYDLLKLFLLHLPEAKSSDSVKAIYQLKLLYYHGLLGEEDPQPFIDLSGLRSVEALLALDLPEEVLQMVDNLFRERFGFYSL